MGSIYGKSYMLDTPSLCNARWRHSLVLYKISCDSHSWLNEPDAVQVWRGLWFPSVSVWAHRCPWQIRPGPGVTTHPNYPAEQSSTPTNAVPFASVEEIEIESKKKSKSRKWCRMRKDSESKLSRSVHTTKNTPVFLRFLLCRARLNNQIHFDTTRLPLLDRSVMKMSTPHDRSITSRPHGWRALLRTRASCSLPTSSFNTTCNVL